MKALFSNPPWWERLNDDPHKPWLAGVRAGSRWPFTRPVRSAPDRFVFGDYLPYPFFLGYAASYARQATGADVRLRDSIALAESYESYLDHLVAERFDFLVVEAATPSWEHDRQLLRRIHQAAPETKIVIAGPITTVRSEEILANEPVHACIRGEYEKGSVRVLGGEAGIVDFDLLSTDEMNAAPFPLFDPPCADRYWDKHPLGQQAPQAQVWSSRGCPFKCIFCVWPAAMTGNDPSGDRPRTVRHYQPEYIEAFLRELIERFGFASIYFDDDTFNLGNRHVVDICAVMARLGVPWSAMCRADTIKTETWGLMKQSGCFGVKIGFESGNQQVVDTIVRKHLDLDQAADVVREIKRLGMTVHGTFTYGLPGETRAQMLDTKRYLASLPLDSHQESGTAEIEGTPLYTLGREGQLAGYEGARLDAEYVPDVDGARKWRRLVEELRDS